MDLAALTGEGLDPGSALVEDPAQPEAGFGELVRELLVVEETAREGLAPDLLADPVLGDR